MRTCLRSFDSAVIEQTQLNMAETDRQERDLIILGILESGQRGEEMTLGKKEKKAAIQEYVSGLESVRCGVL